MNCLRRARQPRLRYAGGGRSAGRLDQTDVCTNCGAVTWYGQMHSCRPRT